MKQINTFINEKLIINKNISSRRDIDYVDLGLPSKLLWRKYNYGVDDNNSRSRGKQISYGSAMKLKFEDGSRLPIQKDFEELNKNCTSKEICKDDIKGFEFTSKINNESIFLPYCYTENTGQGFYWSSEKYNSFNVYTLWFHHDKIKDKNTNDPSNHFFVRQVL